MLITLTWLISKVGVTLLSIWPPSSPGLLITAIQVQRSSLCLEIRSVGITLFYSARVRFDCFLVIMLIHYFVLVISAVFLLLAQRFLVVLLHHGKIRHVGSRRRLVIIKKFTATLQSSFNIVKLGVLTSNSLFVFVDQSK